MGEGLLLPVMLWDGGVIVVETGLLPEEDSVQEQVRLWVKAEVWVPDCVLLSVYEGDALEEALSLPVQPVAELALHVVDADTDDEGVKVRLGLTLREGEAVRDTLWVIETVELAENVCVA